MRRGNESGKAQQQEPEPARVTLTLLGGFELRCAGIPVLLALAPQRLLAFVALQERPVLRAYVAGKLWPDTTDAYASGRLRSALWRLLRCCALPPIQRTPQTHLALTPQVELDVMRQIDAVRRLNEEPLERLESLRVTLEGELLPDWYDDWVFVERERLRQLRLHALEEVARRLTSAGRYGEAVQAALAALRADPLRETAHRILIEAHLAEGNRSEAMRQWRLCRRAIRGRFSVEPSFRWEDVADAPLRITKSRSGGRAEAAA